jgi:CheY-like chemotaxis protein
VVHVVRDDCALPLLRGPTFPKNPVLVLLDMNMPSLSSPSLVDHVATMNRRRSSTEVR